MKAYVLGVVHRHGTAKDSGKPYDFAQVLTLRPIESVSSKNFNQVGHGFDIVEANLDQAALPQFAGKKYPCELDLVTDARPSSFGKLDLVVVGVKG